MKIAHIEDDPAFALLFKSLNPDIEIIHFCCLSDYVDANYSFVVTDLSLPDGFGVETIDRLKGMTRKPIVALTGIASGHMSEESKQLILDHGAYGVFCKDNPCIDSMIASIVEAA